MAKAFEEMGVCAELLRIVSEHEWLVPTPVQTEVIPLMLGGGDVLAAAETRVVRFSKNGVMFDDASPLDPSFGRKAALFPAVAVKNAAVAANFGDNLAPTAPEFIGVGQAQPDQLALNTSESIADRTSFAANGDAVAVPLAIIVEPSRDLAQQVFDCSVAFKKYFVNPSIRSSLAVGGVSLKDQTRKIYQAGGCELVVGTPGRLLEMADHGVLDLSRIKFLVLDEVDQLIATDSVPAIMSLHSRMPSQEVTCGLDRLQVSFFSATLHANGVLDLANRICRHPLLIDLKGREYIPETVHHLVIKANPAGDFVDSEAKRLVLPLPPTDGVHDASVQHSVAKQLKQSLTDPASLDEEAKSQAIKYLKPQILVHLIQRLHIEQCMVFCRTNLDCDLLEQYLLSVGGGGGRFSGEKRKSGKENELSCCVLAGMRTMAGRQQALDAFKSGDIRILICTDVAARGIDVKHLACIINMTLPNTEENYIHRVGRVGRNDAMGLAISIVADEDMKEKVWFHRCNKFKGKGCVNRKLAAEGGCAVLYDETAIKKSIEKRLHKTIETVRSLSDLERTIDKVGGMKQYGMEREALTQQPNPALQKLAPVVRKLAELEAGVQNSWLHLHALTRQYENKP
ncbi:TPA: hypothetical protein N0F65_012205 [Lagenidium giganteum]|uniref:RNA helicase n=1 Tax=Lagenidium giganteum TaxID=4803 RepID=A0AAV2ZHQ8_9STRA|nr:TPA: hypothetical protein N0F65_012205 [Lagenidium giganteum]